MATAKNIFAYPVFLSLEGRRCLVIGGGHVALHKTRSLLAAGARQLTAVAPEFLPGFKSLAKKPEVKLLVRKFRQGDLKNAQVVICATDDEAVNALAARCAPAWALVNVVDRPALCNFIAPAVVRSGPLTLAISTGGASPALARRLRGQLENVYGAAFRRKALRLGRLRLALLKAKQSGKAAAVKRAQLAYFGLLETF